MPVAEQMRLYLSAGRRSSAGRGALIGGLIGAGSGALLGLAAGLTEECSGFCFSTGEMVALFGLGGGVAGALVGLVAGALSSHEAWEPAALPTRAATVRPVVGPSPGGLRVGATLSF